MSTRAVQKKGLVTLERIGDVSHDEPTPPPKVSKLFPAKKPAKGLQAPAIQRAPNGVWFMWETKPPKAKGAEPKQVLHWLLEGKVGESIDSFDNGFLPSFDVAGRKALVVSKGQVFEIDLQTGSAELRLGKKGAVVSDLVSYLPGGRMLVGESTREGQKVRVYDQKRAVRYETFVDAYPLVIDQKVLLGGAESIRVIGLGPTDARDLATFEPGWVQGPLVDDGRVFFDSTDGSYELLGALDAWADCFEKGHESHYPVCSR